MLPAARTSCSIPSPLNALVFCWLLHFNLLFDGHLRPWHNIFFIFFCHLFHRPKRWYNAPPTRSTAGPHPPQYSPPSRTPSFGWLLLKNKKPRPSKAWSPSLSIFLMGRLFAPKAAPPARIKTNRACPTSPTMLWVCASRRVGRQTAMGGGRGGGGHQPG